MKKTAIWASLFTLISSGQLAFAASQPVVENTATAASATTSATENNTPAETPAAPEAPAASPQAPAKLDCNYQIPADQKTVDQQTVIQWTKNATIQSFSFNHSTLDAQMKALENCYTTQGWKGFNDALSKSGNLKVIKSDQLNVSAALTAQPQVEMKQENQWKLTFPMTVVYQNEQEKLTQNLDVSVMVGRNTSGSLGIMQLVANPKQNMNQTPQNTSDTQKTTDSKENQ